MMTKKRTGAAAERPALASASMPTPPNTETTDGEDQAAAERRQWEELERERRRSEWSWLAADVGVRYENCRLENYRIAHEGQREVVARLRAFADDMRENVKGGVGLMLHGPVGTGKDHLMAAMMRVAVICGGVEVQWIDGGTLFRKFRDAIGGNESESQLVEQFGAVRVLAISDPVGARGTLTEHQSDVLRSILDKRYRRGLPTWATINVADRKEADLRLSAPVSDRLVDGAVVLFCNWPSYRKPAIA